MAKKVLIFFPHALKKNFGGAYTYLYYLKNAFQSTDIELIFLSDLISIDNKPVENTPASSLRDIVKKLLPSKLVKSTRISRYVEGMKKNSLRQKIKVIDLSVFDAIHFHETVDIWLYNDLLKEYKGKILLSSHSPKPYHLELLEDVFHLSRHQISKKVYEELETIDLIAFAKADTIIAPCEEALQAYKDSWPAFQQLIEKKKKEFIVTGVKMVQPSVSATKKRNKLHISENGYVVCFNGRHTEVKGYDLVIESATYLLNKFSDVYFIVTGKKDELVLGQHERWIETGWTETPEDFINVADLVIVPNRETYFDLNVLMALSLGKQIVLSNTGGNNFFKQFNSPGILFFDVAAENALTETILKAYNHKQNNTDSINKELFQQNFTLGKFAQAYNQFYLSI